MKSIILIFALVFCTSVMAAEPLPPAKSAAAQHKQEEISCRYYTVNLPEGWQVVKYPEEKNGNISAIFSSKTGNSTVSVIMGPTLGADAKTIAAMFAEQFKSSKKPVEKNGNYTFSFKTKNLASTATVYVNNNIFNLVAISGNQKIAKKFVDNAIIPVKNEEDEDSSESIDSKPETKEAVSEQKETQNTDESKAVVKENKTIAETAKIDNVKDEKKKEQDNQDQTKEEKDSDNNIKNKPDQNVEKKGKPGDYSCEFYKVSLPDTWRAVVEPKEEEGNINAIFASNSGSAIVTFIVGPNMGADAKTIASMFAEEFKATKEPVEKDGRYEFTFPQKNGQSQAIVSSAGPNFMLTTLYGNKQETQTFLDKYITSENYTNLLPK